VQSCIGEKQISSELLCNWRVYADLVMIEWVFGGFATWPKACVPLTLPYPNNWPHSGRTGAQPVGRPAIVCPGGRSDRPTGRCRPCNTLGHRLRWPPAAGNRQQITLRRRPICRWRDYVTSRIARLRHVSTDGSCLSIDRAAAAAAAAAAPRTPTPPLFYASAAAVAARRRSCDQCLATDERTNGYVWFHPASVDLSDTCSLYLFGLPLSANAELHHSYDT